MTSGSTAMARAMHRRCCWPPERPVPGSCRRSFTSSHRPARFRLDDDDLLELGLGPGEAVDARPVGDILEDRLGERIGLLEHHADAGAQLHDVELGVVDVLAVDLDLAGHAAVGMVSFMRLMQRRKVDLPQPEGPMKADDAAVGNVDVTSFSACFSP